MASIQQHEDLRRQLVSRGVKYALASYVDIHGMPKSKTVPIEHLERMMQGSELCTGATLDGVPQDVSDEEVSPHPDPGSVMICPWRSDVAWFAVPLGGGRVELRAADIANNPCLGGAMVLAAGLEGIERKIDPGPPHTENMYLKSDEELARLGVSYLPRTLAEAVDAFERDPLSRAVVGDLMAATFADFKRTEWEDYINHVSDWETKRYLKFY